MRGACPGRRVLCSSGAVLPVPLMTLSAVHHMGSARTARRQASGDAVVRIAPDSYWCRPNHSPLPRIRRLPRRAAAKSIG
jgi:hypothetical protein